MATTPTTPVDPNAPTPQPWTQSVTTPTPNPVSAATPGLIGPVNTATAAQTAPTTVSEQLTKVTDPNSPIMQRATAAANEDMNSRGLLNSSMAVGSAQNAVLNQAVPIASADVSALNTVGMANTQATNTANLQNAQQANAVNTAQAQLTTSTNQQNAQAQNTVNMAELTQANQVQLSALNNKYQSFLNTNSNAATLYNNTIQQIGNIQANPNLDATNKSIAIQQLMTYLEGGLSMMTATSGINLGAGLNFATPFSSTNTSGLLNTVATSGAATLTSAQQAWDAKAIPLQQQIARTAPGPGLADLKMQLKALGPRP